MSSKVVIENSHFTYGGIQYFRANAHLLTVGSYGEKKSPVTEPNYLFAKGVIPAPKLDAIEATVVDIDYRQSNEADILAKVHPVQLEFAGGSLSHTRRAASEGKLKLVMLHMLPVKMQAAINDSPQVRNNLNDYGNDARVVLQTWVIMEAEMADRVKTNSAAAVKATIKGITIGLNGSAQGGRDTDITVEPGATFGYLLGKFEWDAKSKNKRTRIVDINPDTWSFN